MQKTNRELAEFYGIEVGDTVKIYDDDGSIWGIFLVRDLEEPCPLRVIEYGRASRLRDLRAVSAISLYYIGNRKYEVIKPKKKFGETTCCDYMFCSECPLCILNCESVFRHNEWPLYKLLNEVCHEAGMKLDNPIYLALRAELDKEVE